MMDETGNIIEVPWYVFYTMTPEQFDGWKKWTLNYLKTTYLSKSRYEKEFAMFNLMWGLKIRE